MDTKKRRPIRARIMKIVLAIAAASLAITSLFGIISMLGIQRTAENALTGQAKNNLADLIREKTSLAGLRLQKYSEIVSEFAYTVEEIDRHRERYQHLDLDSMDTYDTGDLVFSYVLASEEYDWDSFRDEAALFANVAQRFYPAVTDNRNIIETTYFAFDSGIMFSFDAQAGSVPPELMYYNYFDTDWYALGKSVDAPTFTEVYNDSFGRGLTITCVCPIHSEAGAVIGVMAMDMGITDLYDYILDLDLGEGSSAVISDQNGNIISPDGIGTGDIVGGDRPTPDIPADSDSGILVRENMYFAYDTINNVGWRLCVRVPQSNVLVLANSIGENIVSSIIIFILFFMIILVTVVIVVYEFSEKITKPIIKLTEDAGEISSGDLDHRAEIYGNDEVGDLARGFNEMAVSLQEHISSLTALTAEKERISAELNVAAKIQADMMPKNFPRRGDFSLYASMTPAKEVGGDFYDFFMIDENRLGLVMADVSGKGVPASLFMIIAKTLIKIRTTAPGTPAQMLRDVNNTLCADNPSGLFVTVWLGILTLSTGEIICANAGHEYPVLRHNGGDFKLLETEHCPPLAAMEDIEFEDETIQLSPGDELFLYTDGVPEAKGTDGTRFGTGKMLDILNRRNGLPPEELLSDMKKNIDEFAGDLDPFDDITMLGLIWHGKSK